MTPLEVQILQELHKNFQIEGPTSVYHNSSLAMSIGVTSSELTAPIMSLEEKGFIRSEWVGTLALVRLTSRGVRLFQEAGVESWKIIRAIPHNPEVFENLPVRRTSYFIGRENETQRILDGFQGDVARTLISGSGGIGKTTLALEIAYHCLEKKIFKAVIWNTAELGRELTLDRLLDTIAETLYRDGYKKLPTEDKTLSILRDLRVLNAMIIVDSFETISDSKVETFLRQLPSSVRLLTTSRHLHAVPEEEMIFLRELDEAASFELMRLKSKMKKLNDASDKVLRKLYKATGGMPLALEWAIGQINTGRQTLESVIHNIETAKAQAVYDNLFNTSYQSLTNVEKQILWTLSIFVGSATKPALQLVTDLPNGDLEVGLEQLVEMSLVYSNDEFEEVNIRYSVHQLLRNFAREQLSQQSESVADKLTDRFISYFSDYAKKEIPPLVEKKEISGRQLRVGVEDIGATMRWADVELDNVSAAMNLCYERNYWNGLINLVKTLSYFYATRGYWSERIHHAHQAAEAATKLGDKKAEAWIYINELGYLMIQQGKHDEAKELILKGQEILDVEMEVIESQGYIQKDAQDQQGVQFMIGLAKRYFAILYTKQLKYEIAERFFEEAMKMFERLDRKSIIANQKTEMGELAFKQNDFELAKQYYQECIDYHDKQKDKKPWVYSWMARAYNGLGDVTYQEGNYKEAKELYQDGLNCALQIDNQEGIAYSKYRLALTNEYEQQYDLALELAEESLHLLLQVGITEYVTDVEETVERLKQLKNQN